MRGGSTNSSEKGKQDWHRTKLLEELVEANLMRWETLQQVDEIQSNASNDDQSYRMTGTFGWANP